MMDFLRDWLGWLVAAVIALPVIFRGMIKFDVNEWLKHRRKIKEAKYLSLCPHVALIEENGQFKIQSTYISMFVYGQKI